MKRQMSLERRLPSSLCKLQQIGGCCIQLKEKSGIGFQVWGVELGLVGGVGQMESHWNVEPMQRKSLLYSSYKTIKIFTDITSLENIT